jgi:hypothetical protein
VVVLCDGDGGSSRSASEVQRWLLGLWKTGGWFELEFMRRRSSSTASSVPRSRVLGAWPRPMGVSATASSRSMGRVSTAASSKHSCDGAPSDLAWCCGGRSRQSSTAGISGEFGLQRGPGTWMYFFVFLWTFVQSGLDSCTPYPCTVYLYLYVFLNY